MGGYLVGGVVVQDVDDMIDILVLVGSNDCR